MPRRGPAALEQLLDALPEELYTRALTHASWTEERPAPHERLAFLGDSVLGISVASELYDRFGDLGAGELTKIRAQVVRARAVRLVSEGIGIPRRLEEQDPGGTMGTRADGLLSGDRPLAEITEAVIGACYLTHGFEKTCSAIVEAFDEQITRASEETVDFKSELQERLARSGATVSYEVVGEDGPPHDRRFEVTASARGERLGTGSGRSKKEAEQMAASKALDTLPK